MAIKTIMKIAILIISLSLLSACGELNTPLFSSGGTYQIKAMVNGNSLKDCSLIRKDDKIIPYFAVSVVNDPDLIGLLVYLQNPKGDIIGDKVLYTIDPVDEAAQQETQQEETKLEETEDEVRGEEADGETAGLSVQTMERRTFLDTKPAEKNYDITIPIESFTQGMPPFPLPKNMEIGQYSLVFEAVGRFSTLSITELDIFYLDNAEFRLNDISMYLPWLSDTHLIPVDTTVMLEASLNFDSRLNPYAIWYNGRNIISEGSISEGAGNILWKAPEQSGFYSLRLEVLPYHLKRNFTGIFREITLPVSAKASQTGYFFDNGPDYSAKKPLAAGTVYAEQVKRVEEQITALAAASAARAASSAAAENEDKAATAPIMPEYPELIRWYRFDGSLDETSLKPELIFEEASENRPRWAAVGQSYGLSAGPDDVYLLRPVNFFRRGQDQGGGIFLFYIKPIAEGTIFSAFFPMLSSSSDGVWMDMIMREKSITLRLNTRATSVEMPMYPDYFGEPGFIPIVVEFFIRPYRLEAKISRGEDYSMQSVTGEIRLTGALTGEAKVKLGIDKTAPSSYAEIKSVLVASNGTEATVNSWQITQKPEEPEPAPAELFLPDIPAETVQQENTNNENITPPIITTNTLIAANTLTTIWNEFAVLYSATPILPEEVIEVIVEETLETEEVQNEEPPIKTPVVIETPEANTPPAEKAIPSPIVVIPAAIVNPADAGLENDPPPAETNADEILIEQAPVAEIRQEIKPLPEPVEAEDEEAQPLDPLL